jgi:hypothetical protein
MLSARLRQRLQEIEQEIQRRQPRIETRSPTAYYPSGYQQIRLLNQTSQIPLTLNQVQTDRTEDLG